MKKCFKRFKKDNKGITLVLAIVAVAFVGILATSIVSATMTNYKLKMMNKYSQETFYSADSVVEELHAGVALTCFEALSEAYVYAASNLSNYVKEQGVLSIITKNNEQANRIMKEKYQSIVGTDIFGVGINTANKDAVKTYLNSFITKPDSAKVLSVGNIHKDPLTYGYTIQDVTVEYKKNEGNPYYSTVTIDLDIKYPDIEVDFISDNNELKSYLKYSLIAMDEIDIGDGENTHWAKAILSGGMYAGKDGIKINPGCGLILHNDIIDKIPTVLVTDGDIEVRENGLLQVGENPEVIKGGADVWCNNITVGRDVTPGTVLYYAKDAKTYVADDLTLNGMESSVTLKGTYLGFGSNNALTSNPKEKNSATSSAIIVNGRNCVIDMEDIKTLLLAGKAYVNLSVKDEYATGESLAFKGNQEIYHVPMRYLLKKDDTASEINISNPTKVPEDVKVDLTGHFANKMGLLSDKKYVERVDEKGNTYFFLDFKDVSAQNEYVKCIMEDDSAFVTHARSKGLNIGVDSPECKEKDSIAEVVTMGLDRFFDKSADIKLGGGASVYTSGTLLQVSRKDDMPSMSVYDTNMSYSSVVGMSTSTANKYAIIKSYLAIDEDANYTSFPVVMNIDGSVHNVKDRDSLSTIYEMIVDTQKLEELETSIIEGDGNTIAAVLTSKDPTTSTSYTVTASNGVILGYGVDIRVTKDFEGLIITDGKIIVAKTASDAGYPYITPGVENRAELTLDVHRDVAKYFRIFQNQSDSLSIDSIDVEEILDFSNWRKNENVYAGTEKEVSE